MRRYPLIAAIACGAIAVALAGCGDSDGKSDSSKPPLNLSKSDSKSSSSPSGSGSSSSKIPNVNDSMPFKHDPGQAGKVQDKLTSDGFECTKLVDPSNDLRMCSKTGSDTHDGSIPVAASVSYYSDEDGTVLLARITISTFLNDDELTTMRHQIIESILPADDAAIVAADGSKLTWGKSIDSQLHTGTVSWLEADGYDATKLVPTAKILPLTKEKALPKLQAKGLDCSFGDALNPGQEDKYLSCSGPDTVGDGSDSIRLTDSGGGIEALRAAGGGGGIKNDLINLKKIAPSLTALGDSDDINALVDWIKSNADGKPRSAYVGPWAVGVDISGEGSLTGDSVTVDAVPESFALGLSEDQQAGQGLGG
ncbi:MAG TPA: hypothetical protein VHC49_09565 [Mycobacteriales bacterium]|nr:hypothetical protein [Mycobacteriales bacterium]